MNLMWISPAAFLAAPFLASAAAQDPVKVPQPIPVQADKAMASGASRTALHPEALMARSGRQRKPHAEGPVAEQILAQGPAATQAVHLADAADGRTWASGATYKASFGRDGFTYVPFLGSDAPRNYPVQFELAAVTVGGKRVDFARNVPPRIDGLRVVFERGVVQEIYDLASDGVEQTFVVTDASVGDVAVVLDVRGELVEDAAQAGLQFVNERGGVVYGEAFVVDGAHKRAIGSSFADGKLALHVPAAARPQGALVIDPIISTQFVASSGYDHDNCDVAFDVTNLEYVVVWQRAFSSTDVDVWCEMRDVSGNVVPNSLMAIDNSSAYWYQPRVANLNAYDRFLVVATQVVSTNPIGQQLTIWGRTVDAGAPFARGNQIQISGSELGDKWGADVGGDPNTTRPSYWTVVYTREFSATDTDVHGRQVDNTGTPRAGTLLIENSPSTIYSDVEISQSNGNVSFTRQRWMVVYSHTLSNSNADIYGASLSWDGQIVQTSTLIDGGSTYTFAPSVSAAMEYEGVLRFGVIYRLANTTQNLVGQLVDAQMNARIGATNLSALLGVTNTSLQRIETDGCRFIVAFASGAPGYVATIAPVGSAFVVNEAPLLLDPAHNAWDFNITAHASGGRATSGSDPISTHYAVVYANRAVNPRQVVFINYDGHGPGGFTLRNIGCQGLGLTVSGQAWLGGNSTITLNNQGADLVGMLLGVPRPGIALCTGCQLGVDLGGPLVNLPGAGVLPLTIPCLTNLAGATVTIQGYAAGSGTCLGLLRLSPALDIAIE